MGKYGGSIIGFISMLIVVSLLTSGIGLVIALIVFAVIAIIGFSKK